MTNIFRLTNGISWWRPISAFSSPSSSSVTFRKISKREKNVGAEWWTMFRHRRRIHVPVWCRVLEAELHDRIANCQYPCVALSQKKSWLKVGIKTAKYSRTVGSVIYSMLATLCKNWKRTGRAVLWSLRGDSPLSQLTGGNSRSRERGDVSFMPHQSV